MLFWILYALIKAHDMGMSSAIPRVSGWQHDSMWRTVNYAFVSELGQPCEFRE